MSCSLITGLPGHGKSYFGVMQLLEELRRGKRYVVTNLPLDLKAVGEYCEQWWPVEPDLRGRVRILEPHETAEFWLYDPEGTIIKGLTLFEPENRPWHHSLKARDPLKVPDFSRRQEPSYPGVLYIIDEAHLTFDAHHWQQVGTDCSYFVSQHRKLKADVMFITQHPSKLAKRLRLDLEEWTVVTNLGKVKQWGGVTVPGWFMRETYPGSPDDAQPGMPERGQFRLRPDTIGKLYSTSAGVGLSGRVDTEEQKRGKHWSKWVIKLVCYGGLAMLIPLVGLKGMGALVNRGLGSYLSGATGVADRASKAAVGPVIGTNAVAVPVSEPRAVPTREVKEDGPGLSVTAFSPWALGLSDGRVLLKSEGYRWSKLPNAVAVVGMGVLPWRTAAEASESARNEKQGGFGGRSTVRGHL